MVSAECLSLLYHKKKKKKKKKKNPASQTTMRSGQKSPMEQLLLFISGAELAEGKIP